MHRYITYLRQPRSQGLTIRQYNRAHNDLLDEDLRFQTKCLNAWKIGQVTRRGNPARTLTNEFPQPPALKDCRALNTRDLVVVRPKMTESVVKLTPQTVRSLERFAKRPELGVPANVKHFVHPTSAAAVHSLLEALDFGIKPVLYTV